MKKFAEGSNEDSKNYVLLIKCYEDLTDTEVEKLLEFILALKEFDGK